MHVTIVAALAVLMLPPCLAHAQDTSRNYVRTVTMLDAGGTDSIQAVQYYNGLGWPTLSVATADANGDISSMEWSLSGIDCSYDYKYDRLHRLTDARYDDGLGYTEAFMTNYGYDKNGNIDGIMRQAITMDYEVASLDEMELHYTGNQLQNITNYANPDDFEDYTPYPVSDSNNAYSYDQNGNTTKDLDRNISSIQYNLLNLPRRITYTDGSMATYTYNSLGEKLRVVYATSSLTASLPAAHVAGSEALGSAEIRSLQSGMSDTTVDYCGNLVYNGTGLSRILLGGEGYCRLVNGSPLYFFFIKDHLGSTRVVVRQDGRLVQSIQYYPYGKSWDGGYSQPYLYNGKEIDMMHGLEWYDYGARMYEPGICRFMTMDPLCEKYYNISPYAYCMNNPINAIDIEGKDSYLIIWATQSDQYGHAAIGVDNYTLDTGEKRFVPNGTITVVGLFPDSDYQALQAVKDERVGEDWYVDNFATLDDLKSGSFNSNEKDSPDGILRISTSYEIDCEVMKNISYEVNANKGYKGMSRNCSTFVREGIRVATNQNVKGEESYLGNSYVTPNRLFKDTEKLGNTTVIKNPGEKTNFEFKDLINNTINKTNKKSK